MDIKSNQLLLLLNWMSPAFPIGTYAYSHGLEWAIESGHVNSKVDVESWISDLLQRGSAWNDAVLFVQEYRGHDVNQLALALCSSRERYLETTQLGTAFAIAAAIFRQSKKHEEETAYPVATARGCRAMEVDLQPAILAFLQGFSNALISVAVRLVPLGQTAGLELMRDLMPTISKVAARAQSATLDELGSCAVMSDIASMKHELQYSRMFRS